MLTDLTEKIVQVAQFFLLVRKGKGYLHNASNPCRQLGFRKESVVTVTMVHYVHTTMVHYVHCISAPLS